MVCSAKSTRSKSTNARCEHCSRPTCTYLWSTTRGSRANMSFICTRTNQSAERRYVAFGSPYFAAQAEAKTATHNLSCSNAGWSWMLGERARPFRSQNLDVPLFGSTLHLPLLKEKNPTLTTCFASPLKYDCIKTLSGVPVLFIPGNGGSRRQMRTIASTSARAHNASAFAPDRIMTTEVRSKQKDKNTFGCQTATKKQPFCAKNLILPCFSPLTVVPVFLGLCVGITP